MSGRRARGVREETQQIKIQRKHQGTMNEHMIVMSIPSSVSELNIPFLALRLESHVSDLPSQKNDVVDTFEFNARQHGLLRPYSDQQVRCSHAQRNTNQKRELYSLYLNREETLGRHVDATPSNHQQHS